MQGVLDGIHHIDPTRYIERELGGCVASRVYRLQLCTFNHVFVEKVHLSSGVLSIFRPLGQYIEQTNAANAVRISSATLVLSNSFLSARVLLLSAFRKALNQVFLPVPDIFFQYYLLL